MNKQQKCWFSLLFGLTYRTPQAYAYWWTFPSLENLNIKELDEWHKDNWKRTTYGTDARYNKGHFVRQVQSILDWKGDQSLYMKFKSLTNTDNPRTNFDQLFNGICQIYKFGRMTAWLACQCLYDTVGLNINFNNVLIMSPVQDSSMQSIWNGYCTLKGQYNRRIGNQYGDKGYKPSEEEITFVARDIMRYRDLACELLGIEVDVFKWESIWCQFKRLFHPKESKEYPGHSSGDAASRYPYYRQNWPEVDWSLFREALLSQPGIIKGQTYRQDYNKIFGHTGLLINMHEMYDDMPNVYEVLHLDRKANLIDCLFKDHSMEIPI
jgi:hypothetical protein